MQLLPLVFFFLLLTSFFQLSSQSFRPVASINRDGQTSLYIVNLFAPIPWGFDAEASKHFVVDINAPFSWYMCWEDNDPYRPPFACTSQECNQGRTYLSPMCQSTNNTLVNGQCYCSVTPTNPVTNACASSLLTHMDLNVPWTGTGHHVSGHLSFSDVCISCAPGSLWQLPNNVSLPDYVAGLASLSWSPLSLATQFTPAYLGVGRKFAICLPGEAEGSGVLFFGDGPYYLMQFRADIRRLLSYTPLIRRDNISVEYYIGVEKILIQGEPLKMKHGTFDFDGKGNGGVMLSTVVPYTILRSDIYHAFLKKFSKATHGYPIVHKKIHPFGLCFNTTQHRPTRVGLPFPRVDLALRNGTNWRMFGANSMKEVRKGVACLAFVDGGKTAKQAVVIGSHQLEDNFLQFDLDSSRLGFSSSLLAHGTNCGNFNFTSDAPDFPWG
ncbi:hypothetical protein Tsubulata_030030 [Turnera subulata]|uniref:Peptidase A1 domain-containing protein n=1 Tax=Turnera subulata TaxID=218843 RepID=A0A9Q0G6V7_9ROSI|nr:hypothetical protein Tsubulata_030030 [Turnera subulata]